MQAPTPVNTPASTPPLPSVPQVEAQEPTGDSKKMILWLVIGLVVVIALVGGIYLFLNNQQAAQLSKSAENQPVAQATPKPPDTVDALDRDLNAVNVDDVESDFTSIDQDLGQL